MIKLIGAAYVVGALAALSDQATVAFIAGAFSLINTILLFVLHRKTDVIQADQKATKTALTTPRRIVYDQDGNPIGTVLDLRQGDGWEDWMTQRARRAADQPPSSLPGE